MADRPAFAAGVISDADCGISVMYAHNRGAAFESCATSLQNSNPRHTTMSISYSVTSESILPSAIYRRYRGQRTCLVVKSSMIFSPSTRARSLKSPALASGDFSSRVTCELVKVRARAIDISHTAEPSVYRRSTSPYSRMFRDLDIYRLRASFENGSDLADETRLTAGLSTLGVADTQSI